MKKFICLGTICFAVFVFQACNHRAKDAKAAADSLNKTKDIPSNAMNTGGMAENKGRERC